MHARFLLGPAGSGKTFRCLAEVRAALAGGPEGPPLILLAPKQATFQLERQLLAGGGISGYTRLRILSFERLAQFVLEKLSLAPPKLLSAEGRVMVLRALLMRHAGELRLLGRSARRSGFAREISALLAELQQHQLAPARLRSLAGRTELHRELRDKLHDLALLSEHYAGWLLEHGLQDANCLLDFATAALRKNFGLQPSVFSLSALWLDGFAEMTPQELDLLAAVVPFCERATLAFCLDDPGPDEAGNSWLSIWNAVGKTLQQCRARLENQPGCRIETEIFKREPPRDRFAKSFALAALEAGWTSERRSPAWRDSVGVQASACLAGPPMREPQRKTGAPPESEISDFKSQISIASCANPEAEAIFAAREILKFVRDKSAGNRFRDCAVLVRDLEPFHRPLARIFRRYEIPFFLDRRESVAHHPLAELTRGALRTVAGDWRHDDWFAALKAGFVPVEENEIDRLENAALEFGWRGKKWREPLPDERLERLRHQILPPVADFAAQLARPKNRPTGAQLAGALRTLWDDLRVESTLEQWSAPEPEPAPPATRHPSLHATVWNQMNAWLDNLALAFPHESLSLRDWLPVLETGLANLTVGVIPPVLDEVLIGAIDRARNPDLKFAVVMGMNEGIFPAAPAAGALLTDTDRDELGHSGVALGPDLRERLARERYYGYIACTRASEKLAVAFSRFDSEGRALNPSPFVAQMRRIFPALPIEEFPDEIKPGEAEHASELVSVAAEVTRLKLNHNLLMSVAAGNWSRLLEIPALQSLAGNLAHLREPGEKENLSPALAERLYGPVLQTSVSRLEEYAQCPFRFLVHSGLRAEERKVFELDARERGSFQHEVLKQFHDELAAEGRRWRELTPAEARERITRIAGAQMEQFRSGLLRESAETIFAARAMAESLQDFIEVIVGWMRHQYEFDPVAAELDFGTKNSPDTALKIDLGNGRKLALQGRIDRVDLCRDGDRALAVVTDYKSGGRKLDALLVANGIQLQLLAYLAALRRWPNPRAVFGADKLVPAGAFYVSLHGRFEGGRTRDEVLAASDARQLAYRHNGRFDAGALPQLDRAGAADQFNYRLNQDGSLRKGSTEALLHAEFECLLDDVETRLKEMGRAIFSGKASVDPYRKGAETACEYCDYRVACRIDPWTHPWRVLRAKESIE